jgi:cell division protein FtsL
MLGGEISSSLGKFAKRRTMNFAKTEKMLLLISIVESLISIQRLISIVETDSKVDTYC